MISTPVFFSLLFSVLLLPLIAQGGSHSVTVARRRRQKGNASARSITILNRSGVKFDIFWVHPTTRKLADSNTEGAGVIYGAESAINSYVGHEFEVTEMPKNGKCKKGKCLQTNFKVSSNEDQIFTVWKNFTVTHEDHRTRAIDQAKNTIEECTLDQNTNLPLEQQMEQLMKCMEAKVKKITQETEDEIQFQANLRMSMGEDLTRYSCLNEENTTLTRSIFNNSWSYDLPTKEKEVYNVQTLFETFESRALFVENFVSKSQCQSLLSHVSPQHNAIPLAAKSDADVVHVMLKIQNLAKAYLSKTLVFKEDPLLNYHERSSPSSLPRQTCESSEDGKEECSLENSKEPVMETNFVPPNASVTVILVCEADGGAFHFPRTGVHVPAAKHVGGALVVAHNGEENGTEEGDPYMGEYTICSPQRVNSTMKFFLSSYQQR